MPEVMTPCRTEDDAFLPGVSVAVLRHTGAALEPCQHDYYIILYSSAGHCVLGVDGKPCHFHAGQWLLLPPMITLSVPALQPTDELVILSVRRSSFALNHGALLRERDVLTDFFRKSLYGARSDILLYQTRPEPELEQLLTRMCSEQNRETDHPALLLDALLSELLALLLCRYSDQARVLAVEAQELRKSIVPILHYIEDHLETVTLSDVARQFHYAEPYLSRILKEYTGEGFAIYVRQLRLAWAQMLLENTSLSVVDVAETVGYSSASYFYSAFREKYGVTPAQYRRTHRG